LPWRVPKARFSQFRNGGKADEADHFVIGVIMAQMELQYFDAIRRASLLSSLAADRRPGPLCARRLRLRPAALSEVRVPLIARRHDLWVDLRQSLGGLLSLWRT
jgi:hypothetical protein